MSGKLEKLIPPAKSATGSPVIRVEALSKHYGGFTALKSLNLEIRRGEIFGLLGPNGAGKTTALECILGTKKPDGGRAELWGENPGKNRNLLFKRVGVQFQSSAYPDRIRVGEMCELTACLYRNPGDWRGLLTEFDLQEKSRTMVEDLSGGERQKLSLLLALVHQPEMVFLDELTTGLDPIARREVWRYLKKLQEEGLTIFLTSHFMDEVTYLCDQITILHRGEAVIEGSPTQVVEASGKMNLEEAYIAAIEELDKREGINEN